MGMDGGLSVADALALGKDGNGMFGGGDGGGIWILLLFFLLAGDGGFGNNKNNNCCTPATQQGMTDAFNFNQLDNGIRGLERGICDLGYATQQGFGNVGMQIAENRFAAQQCCCETNRNIDSLRFQSEKNTCDIVNAIRDDGAATRALMTQNTIQELRDQLQAAQLTLGNAAQTQNIVDSLRPFPRPAYITCSPYQAVGNGCANTCGC